MQDPATSIARIQSELAALEAEMPSLQKHAADVFMLASAWAERHDAILDAAPPELRGEVEARLRRIGIRWGMVPGKRMTGQFLALPPGDVL